MPTMGTWVEEHAYHGCAGRRACKAGTQDGSTHQGCSGRECAMQVPMRGAARALRREACVPPALRGSAALGSAWVFPCQVRHQAGLVELRWELKARKDLG